MLIFALIFSYGSASGLLDIESPADARKVTGGAARIAQRRSILTANPLSNPIDRSIRECARATRVRAPFRLITAPSELSCPLKEINCPGDVRASAFDRLHDESSWTPDGTGRHSGKGETTILPLRCLVIYYYYHARAHARMSSPREERGAEYIFNIPRADVRTLQPRVSSLAGEGEEGA